MNEKKNKSARKVLLVGIAAVLVAAISVGSTLAYLSAITTTATNTFTASGNIKGRVLEPAWTSSVSSDASEYIPGRTYAKDPTVDNETSDAAVYVGAKLVFKVDVGDGAGFTTVSYDAFTHFVTLSVNPGTGWTAVASTDAELPADGATNKYYLYTPLLTKDADSGATYTDGATDHTTPLFESVTPSKDINIKSDGGATISNVTANANLKSLVFKKFEFKILVYAHGVKAYTVNSSTGAQVGGVLTTQDQAKTEILSKLASKN